MRLGKLNLPASPNNVFVCLGLVVDNAKMLDITAVPLTAFMIDLHAIRDRGNVSFPNVAMHIHGFPVSPNHGVTVVPPSLDTVAWAFEFPILAA